MDVQPLKYQHGEDQQGGTSCNAGDTPAPCGKLERACCIKAMRGSKNPMDRARVSVPKCCKRGTTPAKEAFLNGLMVQVHRNNADWPPPGIQQPKT